MKTKDYIIIALLIISILCSVLSLSKVYIVEGPQGIPGEKGDSFTYEDFTSEQLENLRGPQGVQGDPGDPFKYITYNQFIKMKGDPFTYEDFTSEQLENLRGPQGVQGEKGDSFTYEDFTSEQLENLRGPQGVQGEKGDPFTYNDFTDDQLHSLTPYIGTNGNWFVGDLDLGISPTYIRTAGDAALWEAVPNGTLIDNLVVVNLRLLVDSGTSFVYTGELVDGTNIRITTTEKISIKSRIVFNNLIYNKIGCDGLNLFLLFTVQ